MVKKETTKRSKGSAGNNRKIGEDFLENNRHKKDVTQTTSGLQYLVVDETTKAKPKLSHSVCIHQRALLLNGTLLEDTYRKNKPECIPIAELIEGLQEGLQLMPEGSRYKFWVPSDLGWGKKGTGNKIPPNAVLFFDIRLLSFE
ncbi:MAG: FKBP-type peptidyl-prolyl cis-trans isomerase [Prolixibacteraceae bacterium]